MPAAHPLWVRVVHWINALAFFVLLTSGWQIYNADPFWSAPFPSWLTLGGSLPGALQWHFSAMWVLAGNGLVAITLLLWSGRLRELYLPLRWRWLWRDTKARAAALASQHEHGHGQRNTMQKLAYGSVLALLDVEVLSGLAIWKPVQLQWLSACFGGYESSRRVHFVAMALLASFVTGHVVLALRSPRLLLQMIAVRPHAEPKPKA